MNILIIEDEKPALLKLISQLKKIDSGINIVQTLGSVKESMQWLQNHPHPDLILLDIQLSDGLSLEIFKKVNIGCPVIFTTAYDDYILDAFTYNGIDYLLKPVKKEKLERALLKYKNLRTHFIGDIAGLIEQFNGTQNIYKKRIIARKGTDFITIETDQIAYFISEHKLVFVTDKSGNRFLTDKTLSDFEAFLNPHDFFRLNRKYLAHIQAIKKFSSYDKGRVKIELEPPVKDIVLVSQEKAADFKDWAGK